MVESADDAEAHESHWRLPSHLPASCVLSRASPGNRVEVRVLSSAPTTFDPKRRALFHLRAISLAIAGRARRSGRSATLPGNEDSLTAALTLRQRSMRRGGFRLSPKLSVWGILGQHVREKVITFYAGADYSRFPRSLRTRRRRHEWRRASCLDATRFRSRRRSPRVCAFDGNHICISRLGIGCAVRNAPRHGARRGSWPSDEEAASRPVRCHEYCVLGRLDLTNPDEPRDVSRERATRPEHAGAAACERACTGQD
jgi:hypothetical protein